MGKKAKDEEIRDIQTGWDGYRGSRVEEFIKGELQGLEAGKAGCFHYDGSQNRYMVFANEGSRDRYLENPEDNMGLLLATFDAPFNYTARIELKTEQFNAVLTGSSGHYIEFTFDTENKSGQSVAEDVICTFTFTRGSVKKKLTQKYRYGTTVRLNVDDYLEVGTNIITIGIVGQTTLAATTIGCTYQMIDLTIVDSFNISKVRDTSVESQMEVPYIISGYGVKVMEWYVDGELIPYVKSEDEITEVSTSRTKIINIEGLSQGTHNIQFKAYTVINGEKFYSKTLYRDFIVYNNEGSNSIIAVGVEFPLGAPIIEQGEGLRLHGITQYLPYQIKIAVFNPTYASVTPLEVRLDGDLLTTLSMQNGREALYDIVTTSFGEGALKLSVDDVTYDIPVDIEKSSTSIEENTQGLILALSATGKSNNSSDRDKWTYGTYKTIFSGLKWVDTSGWNNNSLVLSEDSSVNINCNPFIADITNSGKTLEFEFSTENVLYNDAVVCDLRDANGTGLLITASEASLSSAGGSKVSTRYKPEENIRISFVVTRKSGVTDKAMMYLYVNGILSGASDYATNDNFTVNKTITISSGENTDVRLKSIRIYDVALNANQILNNFILYRDNAEDFLKIYERNNIYEAGTSDFSTDTLSGQLPVMIITGNVAALEATTDKNMQIDVDVEYINLQDQTKSFKIKNGALRPQGTSSMSYPKKNFRLYTNKKDSTILYDADGNEVKNRLYAFKQGAQPVDCWCLKADYAESSGTHNTGVARLWNDVMKNAQIGNEYKCRTNAQQLAIDNGYAYDVRTTIDGFPILMFYRLDEHSPLVFIGKYNFNNDKSTESVFGFCDIPGFNNTKMQCWEVLNNGNHLALFTDTTNWEKEWCEAFEGRYPDGNTNTSDLKAFANWMTTVTAENFAAQKWEHLDVYKVAAYYIYLIRFGAVDQVVKNAMFTSEDGEHWYFINYDNDTVNGLRNDGLLIYPPTISRQTLDPSFSTEVYAYAGHDSRLWNMLEGDTEFMDIVSEVDSALYSAGLTYANVIKMFDGEQSGKWCERVYNQDAQYKYISPFTDRGINNLFMLQGSRQSHRRWWLSERFSLIDAKFVSGEYKANSFEVKLSGGPIGLDFTIKSGVTSNYGYGVNNVPIQYGIELEKGEEHTFTTQSVLNVGDPLRIYAAPYLESINVSNFAEYLTQISIASVYSERLKTKLERLVIGKEGVENTALTELSGINQALKLKGLDIRGMKGLTTLNLSTNTRLETLEAKGSGLTSVILPSGAPIVSISLPATIQAIDLSNLFSLERSGLNIENNGTKLTTISIINCENFDTLTFVKNWLTYKEAEDSVCTLTLEGIDWEDVDPDWLIRLGGIRNLSLKGMARVTAVSEEQLTSLQGIFGKNCFSSSAEFYIKAPANKALYFVGPDTVRGMGSARYELVVTSEVPGETELTIESGSGATLEGNVLSVADITTDRTLTLMAKFTPEEGLTSVVRKTVSLVAIKYPTSATITGDADIFKKRVVTYEATFGAHDDDASFHVEWELTGAAVESGLVSLGTTTKTEGNVIVNSLDESSFTLKMTGRADSDNRQLFTKTMTVNIYVGDIILTRAENPAVMAACYNNGWAAKAAYMTAGEAAAVTADVIEQMRYVSASSFNEFVHFINSQAPQTADMIFPYMKEFTLPFEEMNFLIASETTKVIHAPNLKRITVGTDLGGVETFDAPKLEELSSGGLSEYNSCRSKFVADNLEELTLDKLETINDVAFKLGACRKVVFGGLRKIVNMPQIVVNDSNGSHYERCLFPGSPLLEEVTLGGDGEVVEMATEGSFWYNQPIFGDTSTKLKKIRAWVDKFYISGTLILEDLEILLLPEAKVVNGKLESDTIQTLTLPKVETFSLCIKSSSLTAIETPMLSTVSYSLSSGTCMVEAAEIPEWEELYGATRINCDSGRLFTQDVTGDVEFPNLVALKEGGSLTSAVRKFSAPVLEYVQFGDSLFTFKGNTTLEEVELPSVTYLRPEFFKGCSSLTGFEVPAGITRLTGSYFEGCDSITELSFPGVTQISDNCTFKDMANLEELDFPEATKVSLTNSTDVLFNNLPSLTTVNLPKCETLEKGTLSSGCTSLEELELPECTLWGEHMSTPQMILGEDIRRVSFSLEEDVIFNHVIGSGNLEELSVCLKRTINENTNLFSSAFPCPKLGTINLYRATGVEAFGFETGATVGSEVTGEKTVHVPEGSTAYDSNTYLTQFMAAFGFTLVKDL